MNLEKRKIPRIALIDCSWKIEKSLKDEKWEVFSGSFGSRNCRRYLPRPPYEIDIFFYEATSSIEGEVGTKGRLAITDESPHFTNEQIRERISRGGIFVCFINSSVVDCSNMTRELCYSPIPISVDTEYAVSNYIKLVHQRDLWGSLFQEKSLKLPVVGKLRPYIPTSSKWGIDIIAENENEDFIAAEIRIGAGYVCLLPEFKSSDWAVQALLKEILPKIKPDLFPEYQPTRWINNQEYKFNDVLILEEKLKRLRQKYEKEKARVEEAAEKKESEFRPFKCLLVSTDQEDKFDKIDRLSSCVEQTLKYLGFHVRNIDEERKKQKKDKREDFHIIDGKFFALVECQGTQSGCKEEYFSKLVQYMNLYKTESGKIDIQGLLIINYLRLMPPIRRPRMFEEHVRGAEIRREAEKQGIGLLSAFELFKLVQAEKAKKITKKQVRDCLKGVGLILAEPWIRKCQKEDG